VQNRLFSAGMSSEPFIQLKDSVVGNDDLMALCDELVDVRARERPELGNGIGVALSVWDGACRHFPVASEVRGWYDTVLSGNRAVVVV
jgi:hypothetical protein